MERINDMLRITGLQCEYRDCPLGIDERHPRISWQLVSYQRDVCQTGYRVQVAADQAFTAVVWDTGWRDSDQSVQLPYEGEELQPRSRYYYRVRACDNKGNDSGWSETAFWETGMLNKTEWKAEWITAGREEEYRLEISPLLRRSFTIHGAVQSARIYATALGLYALYINGGRVGDALFTPGWTSYRDRLQYQTYDVSALLREGENVVGAMLGNGWYAGYIAWGGGRGYYGDRRALLLQMHIRYADGREEVLLTDGEWKSAGGPILMSEIYHGETYDARLEKEGWGLPGYDASDWDNGMLYSYTKDILIAQENLPPKIVEEIQPVAVFSTPMGETVLDFGQNMVGYVRFSVQGKRETVVTLKHAEVLDRDGNFYTENLKGAKQTVTYILKGQGRETYEPHFTYQGFRYVRVEGYPGEILPENFTGCVIHSGMEQSGSFSCSHELVNQLNRNILWSQKGNFLDVPTDCPQRDERHGWTGDAQMFIRTACFHMDTALFYTKWLRDLAVDQSHLGGMPAVVPNVRGGSDSSSAAWGDAATICPWTLYLCYGDKRVLERQYESMKQWVEYIRKQGDNPYLWNTGFHFGDWLALDAKPGAWTGATSADFIATAFYAYSTRLLMKTAKVLNKREDACIYQNVYTHILQHFRQEFVTPNGRLTESTQTAHVLALLFDLVEEKDRKRTADTLASLLKTNANHLNTGFVGTPYLCHALSQNGYNDLAYTLLLQTDCPSWLYPVTKGATTIWEHWDGIKEDGSFWDKEMNSFNHYAYGAVGDWLYRSVVGLDTDESLPGYKHIHISPRPGKGLTFAKASYQSLYGEIQAGWELSAGKMTVHTTIPVNTTATLTLPGAVLEEVRENGERLDASCDVEHPVQLEEGIRLRIGSGSYVFTYPYA